MCAPLSIMQICCNWRAFVPKRARRTPFCTVQILVSLTFVRCVWGSCDLALQLCEILIHQVHLDLVFARLWERKSQAESAEPLPPIGRSPGNQSRALTASTRCRWSNAQFHSRNTNQCHYKMYTQTHFYPNKIFFENLTSTVLLVE